MFIHTIIVILAISAFSADACSCLARKNETYADFLCQSTLAVRAVIVGEAPSTLTTTTAPNEFMFSDKVYNIKTAAVYRNIFNVPTPTNIRTPPADGMCGYEFQVGKEYLIIGRTANGFSTNICSHTTLWSNLPQDAKEGLESGKFAAQCKENV